MSRKVRAVPAGAANAVANEFQMGAEMAKGTSARIVLVTCGSLAEGQKIARAVVSKRLAACVNLVSAPVESTYRWKGKV